MILLDIFCAECTPYLLLMLAGAWGLGWFFWKLAKENGYLSNIKKLEGEVKEVKKENVNLSSDLSEAKYLVEKSENELTKLRHKIGDYELKGKVEMEKFNALNENFEKLKADYEAFEVIVPLRRHSWLLTRTYWVSDLPNDQIC